jgi:hypothetical protein
VARDISKRQMGVALGDEMREQLEKAAQASDVSVAEEIRRRLTRTFAEDAKAATVDAATRDLQDKITDLAEEVQLETNAPWHANLVSFAAFRHGVILLLGRQKATAMADAPTTLGERPHQSIPGSDDPQEIGILLEMRVSESESPEHRRAWRQGLEKSNREIVALHERRARGENGNGK